MHSLDKLIDVSRVIFDRRDKEESLVLADIELCKEYVSSFSWCKKILAIYYGGGVAGKLAVFLVHLEPVEGSGADSWVWIICGDLPSAYIRADLNTTPSEALADYVSVMQDWSRSVLEGGSLDNSFPVDADATSENAKALNSRMDFVSKNIINSALLNE